MPEVNLSKDTIKRLEAMQAKTFIEKQKAMKQWADEIENHLKDQPYKFNIPEERFEHPHCPRVNLKPHVDEMESLRGLVPEMMKKKRSAPLTVHERDVKDIWVQTETGYMKLREYFATQGYVKVVRKP